MIGFPCHQFSHWTQGSWYLHMHPDQAASLQAIRISMATNNAHQAGRKVGDVNAVKGTLEDVTYMLQATKESHHIMKMMVTCGRLISDDSCRPSSLWWIEVGVQNFKEVAYTLPYDKISISIMPLITMIYLVIVCLHGRIPGWPNIGSYVFLHLLLQSMSIHIKPSGSPKARKMPTLRNFRRKYGWLDS